MKKIFYLLCVATLTLVACVKDITPVVENEEPEAVTLTFSSERPQLEPTTRTAWNVETRSIVWTENDKIRVGYTLDGVWRTKNGDADLTGDPIVPARFYASDQVSIDSENASIGTFSVPAGESSFTNPEVSGSYQFFAIFPSSILSGTAVNNPAALTVTLPTTQTPGDNTFDPKTDIMVGQSAALTLSGFPDESITLKWTRLVGHLDLKFSNLAFDGTETVSKVTLTFNDEAKVAGSFDVNIPGRTAGAGSENTLVLEGNGIVTYNIEGPDSVKVWASVLPVTFTSVDVEVKTDKATYTRSITGINKTIKRNARNTLTINMATAQREEVEPDIFRLYTGALTEGDYIVYYNGKAMKAAVVSNRLYYEEVTPVDDVIYTDQASIVWHIAPSDGGFWTIKNAEIEQYAAATGSKNQAQLLPNGTDDKSLWTVEAGETTYEFINKARAAASNDPNNKYLHGNGDNGFACYSSSTGGALSLYKRDLRTRIPAPSSVTATINGNDDHVIDVTFSTVTGAASYVIVATPTGDGDIVTKTNVSGSPATISISDGLAYNTTYTISVYAVPSDTSAHIESHATPAPNTVTTGSAPLGYELIHSVSEVTSGRYILAAKVGNDYYGMLNSLPNPGTASSSPVTVTGDLVTTSDATAFVLTFTDNGNNYTIEGSNGTLCYSGNSTSFSTSETGNKALWTIEEGSRGSFRIKNVATTTRAIAFQTGTVYKFGAYVIENITATGNFYDVELFKYTGVVKTNPTTTVTPSPVNLEINETQELVIDTDSDGAVTFESANTDIATVSNSGLVTAVAVGSTTITVKTAATNSFEEGTTSVAVNVTAGPISIASVLNTADDAFVYTSGVVAQTNAKGFILTDGNDNIFVYQNAEPDVVVGQSVAVRGTRGTYNNIPQISGPTLTPGETGQTVGRTTLTTISSENATGHTYSTYVSLTGKLTPSGNFYNIPISGSTTQGSLYYVLTSATFTGGTLAAMANKVVTVTGYITGSTNSYLNIAPVDIVVDPNAPDLSVTPLTTSDNPAAWPSDNDEAKEFTIAATNGSWDFESTNMTWATVVRSGNKLIVTPNVKQATEAHSGSITITLEPTTPGYSDLTATIYLSQAKYSGGGGSETITFSDIYTSDTDVNDVTISGTNFSVVFSKSNGSTNPKYYSNGYAIRWYAKGKLTVSAGAGKTLTSITINYSQHDNSVTSSVSTYTDGNIGSWSGSASSVVFTEGGTKGQNRITSITVTYT